VRRRGRRGRQQAKEPEDVSPGGRAVEDTGGGVDAAVAQEVVPDAGQPGDLLAHAIRGRHVGAERVLRVVAAEDLERVGG
jgi:hypothetical protein